MLLLVLLLAHDIDHVVLLLRAYLVEGLDSLRGALDDSISDSFFHKVDFALPNKLHVGICKRYLQLL